MECSQVLTQYTEGKALMGLTCLGPSTSLCLTSASLAVHAGKYNSDRKRGSAPIDPLLRATLSTDVSTEEDGVKHLCELVNMGSFRVGANRRLRASPATHKVQNSPKSSLKAVMQVQTQILADQNPPEQADKGLDS